MRWMSYTTVMMASTVWTGCVVEVRVGNGVLATERRQVEPFVGVNAAFSIPVDAVEGGEPGVQVSCDENLLDAVVTRVDEGVLVVEGERRGTAWVQIEPKTDCRVRVGTSELQEATVEGSGPLTISGETVPLVSIRSQGAGELAVLAPIVSDSLEVEANGSGDLALASVTATHVALIDGGLAAIEVGEGTTETLSVQISGSGPIYARELVASEVEAVLSGAGDGEVTATQELTATLSGIGDLVVWGSPDRRDVIATGTGRVTYAE